MSDDKIITIYRADKKMIVPQSAYENLWTRHGWLPYVDPARKPFPWRIVERVAIGTLLIGNIVQAVL